MPPSPGPPLREKEWQATLVALLEAFGYVVEHTYPLRTQHGWRTGSTLSGKPDLYALRPPRLLAIECKSDTGRLDRLQAAVLSLHALVPCHRAWVLRPRDHWDTIVDWVRRPAAAPVTFGFEPMDEADALQLLRHGASALR